jgi:ribA/ribD-fused uncharacterized protein
MDGQAVYSLLLGKEGHTFRSNNQIFGEMKKEYSDGEGWTEEFGKAITVKLESFERPTKEYLVPFGRVTEILSENGYEIVGSTMFSDEYASQTQYVLTGDIQAFSFLHRGFVFRRKSEGQLAKEKEIDAELAKVDEDMERERQRREARVPEAEQEQKQEVEVPVAPEEAPKKKRVLKARVPIEAGPEPVFFFSGNPALTEFKEFSNMHEAKIQVDGITFPTVEHYFQWSKAKMFGDTDIQAKILKTASPKSVKSYGKKVKGFDEESWNAKKDEVMRTAVKAKLMQHPDILKKLRDTGDRPIAEADPRGKYWGIGTSSDTSKAKDVAKWPGQNKMGKILMELRTELKE